jgi:hypothetical protein
MELTSTQLQRHHLLVLSLSEAHRHVAIARPVRAALGVLLCVRRVQGQFYSRAYYRQVSATNRTPLSDARDNWMWKRLVVVLTTSIPYIIGQDVRQRHQSTFLPFRLHPRKGHARYHGRLAQVEGRD